MYNLYFYVVHFNMLLDFLQNRPVFTQWVTNVDTEFWINNIKLHCLLFLVLSCIIILWPLYVLLDMQPSTIPPTNVQTVHA